MSSFTSVSQLTNKMIPTILGQNPSSTTLIVGRAIGIYHTFLRNQNLDEHEPFLPMNLMDCFMENQHNFQNVAMMYGIINKVFYIHACLME
jgi:NAD dependent epimerase/dehydratase family enzyme